MLGTKTLGDILSDRESIALEMQTVLDEGTEPWGVKVERVEVGIWIIINIVITFVIIIIVITFVITLVIINILYHIIIIIIIITFVIMSKVTTR